MHVNVLPGAGLGKVGKGGAHSLPPAILAAARCSSCAVGKEAGLMVLIRGNLPKKNSKDLPAGTSHLLLSSGPDLKSNRVNAESNLRHHT